MTQTKPWLDAIDDTTKWLSLAVASPKPATSLDCLYKAMVAITRAVRDLEEEREAHERQRL